MNYLIDSESSIVDGKATVSPNEIISLTEDLNVGDKVDVDFGRI